MQKVILEIAKIPISFESPQLTLESTLHPFISLRKPLLSVQSSFSEPPFYGEKKPFYRKGKIYRFFRIPQGFLMEIDPCALKKNCVRHPLTHSS